MKSDIAASQVELFDEGSILGERISQGHNINCVVEKKVRIKAVNRQQMLLRAVDVEKLVAEDHEVRAIWEFVGRLDLSQYYEEIESVEGEAGRSPFDPQLKISLWVYSYIKGISSAREISDLCGYNPAYQWLTGLEPINHHTLSDFRVKHKEALDDLFTQIMGLLSAEGLITIERVMHDGVKIKACASGNTFKREERIRKHLEIAREQVRLMNEAQEEEVGPRITKARRRAAREKKERLELALEELEKIRKKKAKAKDRKNARVSETEPEARIMKESNGGYAPCYNMQVSTDSKEKIIIGVEVTQSGNDSGELIPGEERVEKNVGRAPDQMVTDGGFINRENIMEMKNKDVDLIGPTMEVSSSNVASLLKWHGIDPAFHSGKFRFDSEKDIYVCPAGNILRYAGKEKRKGYEHYKYQACGDDCQACSFKEKCCPKSGAKGRTIVRIVNAPEVAEFIAKMETEEAKTVYKQRGAVAEFPNAWIKAKIGLRQFRLRGSLKVRSEALWACLAYDIAQWIRLRWRPRFALAAP